MEFFEQLFFGAVEAYSPQTNGICERFHRTMQDEFYSIAFRKRLYGSLEQLQADADAWIREYNEVRPHSGKYCFGKTPMQTFLDAKHLSDEKQLDRLPVATSSDGFSPRVARARLERDARSHHISRVSSAGPAHQPTEPDGRWYRLAE